jgi:UDP-glucose 4-epimerase
LKDAILKSTENWSNEVYNVSTETGISITELIKVIEDELDVQLEVNILPENRTDIENKRVGSVKRLKSIGWEPKNSINQGIRKTNEWIKTL